MWVKVGVRIRVATCQHVKIGHKVLGRSTLDDKSCAVSKGCPLKLHLQKQRGNRWPSNEGLWGPGHTSTLQGAVAVPSGVDLPAIGVVPVDH